MLEPHQEKAIHDFIRSLLLHDLQPTHDLVFNAIVSLKRLQNPEYSGPTKRSYRRGEIAEWRCKLGFDDFDNDFIDRMFKATRTDKQ